MKTYLEKLKSYVENHPIRFEEDSDAAVLDALYWYYSETHGMNNEKTRQASSDLNDCIADLSLEDNDSVFSLVGTLCAEHERIAFIAGLRLGVQLMMEAMAE